MLGVPDAQEAQKEKFLGRHGRARDGARAGRFAQTIPAGSR